MQIPKVVASFINNLSPALVRMYHPDNFRHNLEQGLGSDRDPNVPAAALELGFAQDGGIWHAPEPPSKSQLYKWDFIHDSNGGRAVVTPLGLGKLEEVELTPRLEITDDDQKWIRSNPVLVSPVTAALAVYKRGLVGLSEISEDAFDYDANERVVRFLLSGGSEFAENLNVRDVPGIRNFYGIAALMDTACRTPDRMSKGLIRNVTGWYASTFNDATLWIGAGTENVPLEQRVNAALKNGQITENDYIRFRLEQIKFILDSGHTPIMFPDQMQNGYGDERNIELIGRLLGEYPNKIVLHKLGSPFNSRTDYLNLAVLQAVCHLAYAVKTSDPNFPQQIKDYQAIRNASVTTGVNVPMHTGDDRGFPFVWEMGAREQLKEKDDVTYRRNGFDFIAGRNISALLGYIGLNPRQTIKAIIELSKFFEQKSRGVLCEKKKVEGYLDNYWRLMAPAIALSTDCFFGKYDRTPAYTGRVESASRFFGVLNNKHGSVLDHRGPYWKETIDRKIMDGRLLTFLVNAGAITVEELPVVVGRNHEMLFEPRV